MKTILFFFALLAGVTASATVTVTPISTDNANKKVTFKVEWTGSPANNRVWVWVDLCPIEGVTPGTFAPAAVTAASVVGSYYTDLNGRGFYIYGPATVTATLSIAAPGGFNWCVYGSDFPPNAIDNGSGVYTLKGTPPFIITTASGNVQLTGYTFAGGENLELTDATGCPGVFCGRNGEAPGLLNCCVSGTTDCNGTCRTTGTYTQNDGACAGACNRAYVRQFDQCGNLKNATYSTYTNTGCTTPNYTTNDGACTGANGTAYVQLRNACGTVINAQYATRTDNSCKIEWCYGRDPQCTYQYRNAPTQSSPLDCQIWCLKYILDLGVHRWYADSSLQGTGTTYNCRCYYCY
jgi:hypothetical protein